ncbi:MAG: hypothetical protein ACRDA5_11075, partial [Clostridium sp.]
CSTTKKPVDNANNQSSETENKTENKTQNKTENKTENKSQNKTENKSQNSVDTSLLDNIDTASSPFEKGSYNYAGTINNNLGIQMSISQLDKDIVGSYFYDSKKIEIKLKGKSSNKDFVLYEYDESGENTGVFKGTITTVDKIEGTWLSPDGKKSYPFTLSLENNNNSCDKAYDNISEKTKNYIMNGQGDKCSAEQIKWSKTFLDKVDIEGLYKSYKLKGGNSDDLESFGLYITKNAPIPSNWKDLFEKDLFNIYGEKVSRLEPLQDYPDYYQAYVIIDGAEKPFVVVSSRTGDFHG